MNPLRLTTFASSPKGGALSICRQAKKAPPFGGAGTPQGEMTERVLLPLRQRHAQHQTDADGQCYRNFKGADALGKGKGVFVLDEIVGGVVDARARHKREMPVSKNTVTGVFWVMANTRVRMVSGMTASREAVAASAPSRVSNSYHSQPTAPTSAQ